MDENAQTNGTSALSQAASAVSQAAAPQPTGPARTAAQPGESNPPQSTQPAQSSAPAQSASSAQSATQAQPSNQNGPKGALTPVHQGGLRGIVQEMFDAMAGAQSRVYKDEAGDSWVKNRNVADTDHPFVPAMSRGEKWGRIAQEAIGIVGGAAEGANAGINHRAPQGMFNGSVARARAGAESTDQDAIDKAQLEKFNAIKQQHDLAAQNFEMTQSEIETDRKDMAFHQAQLAQELKPREQGGFGSIDLGTAKDMGDLATQMQAKRPDFWKQVYEGDGHNIKHYPEYDADGKQVGIHVVLRTQDVATQAAPEGATFKRFVPGEKPGELGHLEDATPSGQQTIGQLQTWTNAALKQQNEEKIEAANLADKNAQTDQREAAAKKAGNAPGKKRRAAGDGTGTVGPGGIGGPIFATSGLPQGADGNVDMSRIPVPDLEMMKSIANGDQRVSDLLGRMTGKERAYFMEGAHAVDPSFASSNYNVRLQTREQYASQKGDAPGAQITSFNTLLDHLQAVSDNVNSMRNGNSPWMNTPINTLVTKAKGDPKISTALTPIIAARTEYMEFLNNNHALYATDREDAQKILNENMSPAQMQEGARSIAHTAAARLDEKNNGYRRVFDRNYENILSPTGEKALRNFGLGEYADRLTAGQQHPQAAPQAALTNLHTNLQTNQTIGWNGTAWVDTKTGQVVK